LRIASMIYQSSQRVHGLCNRVYDVLYVMLTTDLSLCPNLHTAMPHPKHYCGRWVSSGLKCITGVSVPNDQGQNDLVLEQHRSSKIKLSYRATVATQENLKCW